MGNDKFHNECTHFESPQKCLGITYVGNDSNHAVQPRTLKLWHTTPRVNIY